MIRTVIFEKEKDISSVISDMLVPSLGVILLIQIYNEAGEANFFSSKQETVFEQFFYHNSYQEQLREQLRDFYEELVNKGELERKDERHFELDSEFVAVPSQCKTSKNIVYVGAFTSWGRKDNEFPLEIEAYFEEGGVMQIDELRGAYTFPHQRIKTMTNKIVIIDLGATCWGGIPPRGKVNEIIGIGICLLDTLTGEISDNRGVLVRPTHSKISPFYTRLTTITPELVAREGINLGKALQIPKREYRAYRYIWVNYGNYDKDVLQRQRALRELPYPVRNEYINVKELFQEVTQHPKRLGMRQALNYLKIPLIGTRHRDKDDTYNIAKITHCLSHYQLTN